MTKNRTKFCSGPNFFNHYIKLENLNDLECVRLFDFHKDISVLSQSLKYKFSTHKDVQLIWNKPLHENVKNAVKMEFFVKLNNGIHSKSNVNLEKHVRNQKTGAKLNKL